MANFKIHFQQLHALYTKKNRNSAARAKSSRENEDRSFSPAKNLEISFMMKSVKNWTSRIKYVPIYVGWGVAFAFNATR